MPDRAPVTQTEPTEDAVAAARAHVRETIALYPGAIPAGALVALEKAIRADERSKAAAASYEPSPAAVERALAGFFRLSDWRAELDIGPNTEQDLQERMRAALRAAWGEAQGA